MSVNIVLKIKEIPGESSIKGHEKEIDCLSWSWGMTQSSSAHLATGAGTGSADVHDLTITKYVDVATPNLHTACFNGSDVGPSVLTAIKVGGKSGNIDYVKILDVEARHHLGHQRGRARGGRWQAHRSLHREGEPELRHGEFRVHRAERGSVEGCQRILGRPEIAKKG